MGHLKRLKLKNWMLMKDVDLKLGPGPYFIQGQNNDETALASNGAGKSLLCESILWVLFQHTRKNQSVKDVVGPHGDEAYGLIEMSHKGSDIVIERRRTSSKSHVKILKDGADLSVHKDPEDKILQLMGVSRNTLIVAGYEGLPGEEPLVSYTDTALKNEVMRILDLERFKLYDRELGKLQSELSSRLDEASRSVAKSLAVLEEVEKDLGLLMEKLAGFEDLKRNKIADYKNKILELEMKAESVRGELADVDKLKKQVRSTDDVKQRLDVLTQDLRRLSRDIASLQRSASSKEVKLAKLKNQSDDYQNRLENLTNNLNGECSYCGSELSHSSKIGDKIRQNELELGKVLGDAIELEVEIDDAYDKIETKRNLELEKREKHEELSQQLQERQRLLYEIKAAMSSKKLLEGYEEQISSYTDELATVEAYSKESLLSRIEDLNKRVERREGIYDDDAKRVERIESNIGAIKKFRAAISAYRDAVFNAFAMSLQDLINDHFDRFSEGDFHCDLVQSSKGLSFTFTSRSKDGEYLTWHQFSTGERVRIQKAVVMALVSLLDLPFLVDDESFHGVDDTRPILRFMLDACEDRTLLYISHRVTSKDFFDRCNKILVEKTNGVVSARLIERV